LNPDFKPWTAPNAVPAASRAAVEAAVLSALTAPRQHRQEWPHALADGTTAIVLSFGNVGSVDEWGVELGTGVSFTRALTFSAGYTWYNFAIRQNLVRNVLAPNTPQNKGTVALAYAGRQGIDLGVDARIVSRYIGRQASGPGCPGEPNRET